jgi:hypothetical protein
MRSFNYRLTFKWAIIVAIFFFLGKMVWDDWNQVKVTPLYPPTFPFHFIHSHLCL